MQEYYHHVRREIEPLIPERPGRVLDLGCGAGQTLAWLKTIRPGIETVGVELNGDVAEDLKRNADVAVIRSVEGDLSDLGRFDVVLLLDVLEHLANPTKVLGQVANLLEPEGCVIVSLPNVSHYSVSLPLILRRQFRYADSGILDRTHLHFFVEETALELLNSVGLHVDKGLLSGLDGPRTSLFNRMSLGIFKHHLTKQYIMRAHKAVGSSDPRAFEWEPLSA